MKKAFITSNNLRDPFELTGRQARKMAKDMACIRYCGDGIKTKGNLHANACPYWDPFRRKNHI